MAQNGYQVDPNELNQFASYLSGTTHAEIGDAKNGVTSANGFDYNAFGLFLAQALGAPARIAMAVASDNLSALQQTVSNMADVTKQTADSYSQNEQDVASNFQTIHKEL